MSEKDILTSIFGQPEVPKETIFLTKEEQVAKLLKYFSEINRSTYTPGVLLKEVSFTGLLREGHKGAPLLFIRYLTPADEEWYYNFCSGTSLIKIDRFDCIIMIAEGTPNREPAFMPHNSTLLVPFDA